MAEKETSAPDIPDSLLTKLYDKTGNSSGGNKGFIVFYVSSDGTPNFYLKCSDLVTKIALDDAVKQFLRNMRASIFEEIFDEEEGGE